MFEIVDSKKVAIVFSQNRKWITTAKFLKTQSEMNRKNTVKNDTTLSIWFGAFQTGTRPGASLVNT